MHYIVAGQIIQVFIVKLQSANIILICSFFTQRPAMQTGYYIMENKFLREYNMKYYKQHKNAQAVST